MPEPTVGDAANAVAPRVRMKEDGPRAAPPCVRLYALRRFSLNPNARNVMKNHSKFRTRLPEVR